MDACREEHGRRGTNDGRRLPSSGRHYVVRPLEGVVRRPSPVVHWTRRPSLISYAPRSRHPVYFGLLRSLIGMTMFTSVPRIRLSLWYAPVGNTVSAPRPY